jgi:hypothetical protein
VDLTSEVTDPVELLMKVLCFERAGMAWPLSAMEEAKALLVAYARRSALYTKPRLAQCTAEVFARSHAGLGGGELPASLVLRSDEPPEAALDQVQMAALGARVHADGDERSVEALTGRDVGDHLVDRLQVTVDLAGRWPPTLKEQPPLPTSPIPPTRGRESANPSPAVAHAVNLFSRPLRTSRSEALPRWGVDGASFSGDDRFAMVKDSSATSVW